MKNTKAQESISQCVYIVDDDTAVRIAIADLMASVALYTQTYEDWAQFMQATRLDVPSCLILDVRMPGGGGLSAFKQLQAQNKALPTILISGHGDIAMAVEAIKAGAIDFLTKPFRDQALLDAVHQGLKRDEILRDQQQQLSILCQGWQSLNAGEKQVALLVVEGKLNKQIASILHVSEITVKVRRSRLMQKLNLQSTFDLNRLIDQLKSARCL